MPVIIKTSEMQYKDGNGDYHGINAVAEKKVSEQIADLDAAITTRETRIDNDIDDLDAEIDALGSRIDSESTRANGIISQMRTTVAGIESQRQTMIESIASVAGQGTDTTLSQSGVAADAKATGDAVSDLKAALTSPIHELSEVLSNAYDKYGQLNGYTLSYNATTHVISKVSDSRFAISNYIAVSPGKSVFPCGSVNGADRGIANSCRSYYVTDKGGTYVTHSETMTAAGLTYTNNTSDVVFVRYIIFINHSSYTVTNLVICVADSASAVPYKPFGHLKYQAENEKQIDELKNEDTSINGNLKTFTPDSKMMLFEVSEKSVFEDSTAVIAQTAITIMSNSGYKAISIPISSIEKGIYLHYSDLTGKYEVPNKLPMLFSIGGDDGATYLSYFSPSSITTQSYGWKYNSSTGEAYITKEKLTEFASTATYIWVNLYSGDEVKNIAYISELSVNEEITNIKKSEKDIVDSIGGKLIENIVYKFGIDHVKDFDGDNKSGNNVYWNVPNYTSSADITANGFALENSKKYDVFVDFTINGLSNIVNDSFRISHAFRINNAGLSKNEVFLGYFDKSMNRIAMMIEVTTASDIANYKCIPIIAFYNMGSNTANVSISMNNYVICEHNENASATLFSESAYKQNYLYNSIGDIGNVAEAVNGNDLFDAGNYPDLSTRIKQYVDDDTLVKSLTFLWVTDFHCLGTSEHNKLLLNMVGALKNANTRLPVSGLIDTGDIVNTTYKTEEGATDSEIVNLMTWYINLMSSVNQNYYYTPGNHDGKTVYNYDYTVGFYKMFGYKTANNPTIHGDGIRPYYYVDYPDLNLRMIYLAMPDGEGSTYGPGATQLNWLANTALNTPNNYSVILVYHIASSYFDDSMSSGFGNRTTFTGIVSAYHNHTTFSDSNISCDYTGKSGTKVVCALCGHTHYDSIANPGEAWTNAQGSTATFTSGMPCKEIMSTFSMRNGGFNILTYIPSLNQIQIKRVNGLNRTISVN